MDKSPLLFIPPDYGLANRLRGLVGVWAQARRLKAPLHILWTLSNACPYRIEDLFEPLPGTQYITEQERLPLSDYQEVTSDVGFLNDILIKYNIPVTMAPILTNSLKPVASIRSALQERVSTIPFNNTLGLHIRRTDLIDEAVSQGYNLPALDLFWSLCDSFPSMDIFLACDDSRTLEECRSRYGKRVHIAKEFSVTNSGSLRQTDGEHAVLDIYCLAMCKIFQGSPLSSFTRHVELLRRSLV